MLYIVGYTAREGFICECMDAGIYGAGPLNGQFTAIINVCE